MEDTSDWIENAYVAPDETRADPERDASSNATPSAVTREERIERCGADRLAG